jgi:hypothetical protein
MAAVLGARTAAFCELATGAASEISHTESFHDGTMHVRQ